LFAVLVNWYRNNEDNISAHSDAEDSLLLGAPIASVTLVPYLPSALLCAAPASTCTCNPAHLRICLYTVNELVLAGLSNRI
jgi:hypothetical protein